MSESIQGAVDLFFCYLRIDVSFLRLDARTRLLKVEDGSVVLAKTGKDVEMGPL